MSAHGWRASDLHLSPGFPQGSRKVRLYSPHVSAIGHKEVQKQAMTALHHPDECLVAQGRLQVYGKNLSPAGHVRNVEPNVC